MSWEAKIIAGWAIIATTAVLVMTVVWGWARFLDWRDKRGRGGGGGGGET